MTERTTISAVVLGPDGERHQDLLAAGLIGGNEPLEVIAAPLSSLQPGGDIAVGEAVHAANVVVLVHLHAGDELQQAYSAVRGRSAAPILLVAADELSVPLIEEAAQLGVFDVLHPSIDASGLRFAIERGAILGASSSVGPIADEERPDPRLVSVMSVRGGAGSTTISSNIAAAKSRLWARDVLVLDLDLEGADLALASGVTPERTIIDLVRTHGDIDWTKLRSYVVHTPAGYGLLPGARWAEDAQHARPELILDVVAAARGHADLVVADLPQSFSAPTIAALDRSDALLLVLTPEVASVKHAVHALERLDTLRFDLDRVHLILNRDGAPGAISRRDVEHTIGRPVAVCVADDPLVRNSLNIGVPLVQQSPSAPASRGIIELCELLGERHDTGKLTRARTRLFGRRRSSTPAASVSRS